jgi:hypothetical protein
MPLDILICHSKAHIALILCHVLDSFPDALEAARAGGYQSRAERVGSLPAVNGRLLPAKHDVAMMSLDNAFQVRGMKQKIHSCVFTLAWEWVGGMQ